MANSLGPVREEEEACFVNTELSLWWELHASIAHGNPASSLRPFHSGCVDLRLDRASCAAGYSRRNCGPASARLSPTGREGGTGAQEMGVGTA